MDMDIDLSDGWIIAYASDIARGRKNDSDLSKKNENDEEGKNLFSRRRDLMVHEK